jgi:uncharacterized protein
MQIYLPIAEMSESVLLLLAIGGVVGFLSGLFGVGGGFMLTPLLIFLGVPSPVAVASGVNQVVATSISGMLAHWRRGTIDLRMGTVLLVGGLAGSIPGVMLFSWLRKVGQVDLVVALCYVIFLGGVGILMCMESVRALLRKRKRPTRGKLHRHFWVHGLPFKMRFPRSRLYISALLPLGLGVLGGVLAAIMGIGGGFIMVPAMIYLLGMPTSVVAGTSLFQILFVAANVTFLQAVGNQSVDILLAAVLMLGSVTGAQIGSRAGAKLPAEQFRLLLGFLVLVVGAKLLFDLVATPDDIYTLQ